MKETTILVIEDNALNLKLVRSLLSLGGYRVLEAEDAEKGIQMASLHQPDLILMDIQLPGIRRAGGHPGDKVKPGDSEYSGGGPHLIRHARR